MPDDLRAWLTAHHPDLLADYDRYQRDEGTLRLDGWLLVYHQGIYREWRRLGGDVREFRDYRDEMEEIE